MEGKLEKSSGECPTLLRLSTLVTLLEDTWPHIGKMENILEPGTGMTMILDDTVEGIYGEEYLSN